MGNKTAWKSVISSVTERNHRRGGAWVVKSREPCRNPCLSRLRSECSFHWGPCPCASWLWPLSLWFWPVSPSAASQLILVAQQLAVALLLLSSGSCFSASAFGSVLLAPLLPPTLACAPGLPPVYFCGASSLSARTPGSFSENFKSHKHYTSLNVKHAKQLWYYSKSPTYDPSSCELSKMKMCVRMSSHLS